MAREICEKTQFDSDESITSLDVKSLYTNIPLKEDVEIDMMRVYEQIKTQELSRKSLKTLLNLAVSKVHFERNVLWCVQKDGLAMASLGLILASLWFIQYKPALTKEKPKLTED